MNSAKAIIKGNVGKPVKKTKKEKNPNTMKIVIGMIIAVTVVICVLIGMEQLQRKVALKVGETKLYYDDMMYYAYQAEMQGSYMAQLYQQLNGGDYWNMTNEDGSTNQEMVKNQFQQQMIQDQIMYDQAVKAGYTIEAEEKSAAAEEAKTFISSLSSGMKTQTRITQKHLTALLERIKIAARYKQDLIDGFPIDDEGIKAGFAFEDYRQYDVEYYFASKKVTAEDGTATDLDDAAKQELLTKITALGEKAKTAPDFTKMLEEGETAVTFNEKGFVAEDGTFEADLEKELIAMNNNDITGILDREDGYYFFKMVNNNSTETFDGEVEKAITEAETTSFDEAYQALFGQYEVSVASKIWDQLVMGKLIS